MQPLRPMRFVPMYCWMLTVPKRLRRCSTRCYQSNPENALAHETMGSLKFRENDIAAAQRWYSEAVKLDTQSYLAHYYFAVLTLQAGDRNQDDAIEQSLQTAIKLNPRFAPSYDALANLYASRHEKLTEAHRLNVMAINLEPESIPYRLNTAAVLEEDRQFDSALRVLQIAAKFAKTEEERASVESRISQIKSYQESVEQTEKQNQQMAAQSSVASAVDVNGRTVVTRPLGSQEPEFPAGSPTAPHHTVTGVLRGVKCSYPTVLTLNLERPSGALQLYTNNYYKVDFSTGNYAPPKEIQPCTDIEGLKARVTYGEVTDKRVAGQILAIELNQ